MTRPYSLDLRERVVAAVEQDGLSRHQAAARFAVAVSTVVHWVRRYWATGSVAPGKVGGHKKRVLRGEAASGWRAVYLGRPGADQHRQLPSRDREPAEPGAAGLDPNGHRSHAPAAAALDNRAKDTAVDAQSGAACR